MPTHIARWSPERAVWETDQMDLFSERWEPFSETFPTSGVMTRDGLLFPLLTRELRTSGRECLSSRPGLGLDSRSEPSLFCGM